MVSTRGEVSIKMAGDSIWHIIVDEGIGKGAHTQSS